MNQTILLDWFCSDDFGIEATIFHQILINNVIKRLPSAINHTHALQHCPINNSDMNIT